MKTPHYISFDLEQYDSKAEMFEAIGILLQILTDANYVCSIRYEDCGIYVVEYDYASSDLAQFELWHEVEAFEKDGE